MERPGRIAGVRAGVVRCVVTAALGLLAGCADTLDKLPPSAVRTVMRIDPSACVACGRCADACPHGAVSEVIVSGQVVYVIDPALCTGCGECRLACRNNAIVAVPY